MKTVIFDVGETLLQGMVGMELAIGRRLKTTLTLKDLSPPALYEFFRGEITEMCFWRRLIGDLGWSLKPEELVVMARHNFSEVPGMRSIVNNLKRRGLKLGVLSIHGREWVDYCEQQFDYHRPFDRCSYSFHEGLLKPDPRSYQRLLDELGDVAGNCLFIDDKDKNVEAARKLGMTAIRFTDAAVLESELRLLGLL